MSAPSGRESDLSLLERRLLPHEESGDNPVQCCSKIEISAILPCCECKTKGPLHHIMVVCGHPCSPGRSMPQPYVVSMNMPVQVEL